MPKIVSSFPDSKSTHPQKCLLWTDRCTVQRKQGRIHGTSVADGWAGSAMRKPLAIQKCDGGMGGRTDRHGKAESRVSAIKTGRCFEANVVRNLIPIPIYLSVEVTEQISIAEDDEKGQRL